MLYYILIAAEILLLIAILVLLAQIVSYFKKLPEDEVIGPERSKYLITRLKILGACFAAVAVLQIAVTVLRFLSAA